MQMDPPMPPVTGQCIQEWKKVSTLTGGGGLTRNCTYSVVLTTL